VPTRYGVPVSGSGVRDRGPGEPDGGQAVEPDGLDQPADVRLRPREPQRAAMRAQALGETGEVDDHRRVGERQLGQVDDDVAARPQGSGDRTTTATDRRPVLVPRDDQDGQLFIETDDRGNLVHTE
jgi:hypothetical protein